MYLARLRASTSAGFFCPQTWQAGFLKEQGGEEVDHGKSTPERVARRTAQTLSQESRQKRYLEHGPPKALVRFEK